MIAMTARCRPQPAPPSNAVYATACRSSEAMAASEAGKVPVLEVVKSAYALFAAHWSALISACLVTAESGAATLTIGASLQALLGSPCRKQSRVRNAGRSFVAVTLGALHLTRLRP